MSSSEEKKFAESYDNFSKDYKDLNQTYEQENKVAEVKPTGLKRKYIRLKQAGANFWVLGKTGFQLGLLAGGILGFVFGAFESIRIKSFLPLPMAMIAGSVSFGFIFAVSTVIRSNPADGESGKYMLETIHFDKITNSYVKTVLPLDEKTMRI